jgi:chromosome segregation ATPase
MPQASAKKAARSVVPPVSASGLPSVRLEVRTGGGRPTVYEVGDGGFLIGGVPGCDLRLPGGNVAPVVCLISRHARGASLRKLAPVQAVAVNGRPSGSAYLSDGDRISLGTVEITASVAPGQAPPGSDSAASSEDVAAREAELRARAEALEKDQQRLHAEIEAERRKNADAEQREADLARREEALRAVQDELDNLKQEFQPRLEEADRQHQEARGIRRQMAQIREQLYERYRNRRDHLRQKQKAIARAARSLQERKREIDEMAATADMVRKELELGRAENEARAEQLVRDRMVLDEEHRRIAGRQAELQEQLAARVQECEDRERKVAEDRTALERGQKQHQADLVRLDRIQAQLEQRQKQLEARALEVDKRYEQLQRDLRDLEEQAVQMDECQAKQAAEVEKLAQQKEAHDAAAAQVEQRAAALEGQQAMLATLRTRVERMREDVRRQEEALSDQRAMQEASESDLKTRLEEVQRLREELDNDRLLHHEERRRFEETRATMDAAVTQLREAQAAMEAREAGLNQRQEQLDATAAEQTEQAGLIAAHTTQLEEQQNRISADRRTLRDREAALTKAEQTLTSLQEQLRRRSEELAERQKAVAEQEQKLRGDIARLEELTLAAEQDRQQKAAEVAGVRKELDERAGQIDALKLDLLRREEALRAEAEQVRQEMQSVNGERQAAAAQRMAFDADREAAKEDAERQRREFETMRAAALELMRGLPDLETRAAVGMDRLLRAREQLREHLAEVHNYARQSREDLESARQQVQSQADRVRAEELALHAARDEHRMAVAAFRQQLAEWQGRVAEMKQALARGETRLEQRQAEVQEQAEQVASTSARLAQQAEELQAKERQAAQLRSEMDWHLSDMREWYRRKLRELSGVDAGAREVATDADAVFTLLKPADGKPTAAAAPAADGEERGVLPLNDEAEPGDRQLGDLLRSLDLVDADALAALLHEARRQRRSLRQLLLAGNYLTLYQMALIEAGNLDGLVLGPARVIDRLQSGPREAVYRVFDPRRNGEALLRWLAESEMHDAVRPDEFRQRFASAVAVRHPHVAATYEVLEIAGRPAALQEWLTGVPGSEWPPLSAAPGVWFRLLSQAALALRTVHDAGLVHGALEPASFVCTADGVVKLCGLGEPPWLAVATPENVESDAASDLRALGRIAAAWAASAPVPPRRGKVKAMPEALESVLARLKGQAEPAFTTAAELLDDLDRVSAEAPANATAWERFVRAVREQAAYAARRRSA